MKVDLIGIGKKFNKDWLFRNVSFAVDTNSSCAIIGYNGSGKSTLLQIILGYQVPSKGEIQFNDGTIENAEVYKQIGFVAPYLDLPEELTLQELLQFHFTFKKQVAGVSIDDMIAFASLQSSKKKAIKYFSSGMKQRVKLLLAAYAQTDLLLLDEPCSNLDNQGVDWYVSLMNLLVGSKTIIVASNQEVEYSFCNQTLDITSYIK